MNRKRENLSKRCFIRPHLTEAMSGLLRLPDHPIDTINTLARIAVHAFEEGDFVNNTKDVSIPVGEKFQKDHIIEFADGLRFSSSVSGAAGKPMIFIVTQVHLETLSGDSNFTIGSVPVKGGVMLNYVMTNIDGETITGPINSGRESDEACGVITTEANRFFESLANF